MMKLPAAVMHGIYYDPISTLKYGEETQLKDTSITHSYLLLA